MNCNGIIKSYDAQEKKRTPNKKHYEVAGLRSLTSLFAVADCSLLYKLCVGMGVEPLCERLMAQCHTSNRNPNKLFFFDYSRLWVGRSSFVNRAKLIAELIPFDWLNLSPLAFKNKIKQRFPIFMK